MDNRQDETAELPVTRPWKRRRVQVIGALGAAAVLGAGALVAQQMTGDPQHRADVARAPDPPAASDQPPSTAPGTVDPGAGATASGPGGSAPAAPPAAKDNGGAKAADPPTASPIRGIRAPADVPVVITSYGPTNGQTMQVVSAHADLTGQRELVWAGDDGRAVGPSRCTQNFRFSPDVPPAIRPTMLLCWRLSAKKSVYVLTVNPTGTPSESETVAMIDKEWAKL